MKIYWRSQMKKVLNFVVTVFSVAIILMSVSCASSVAEKQLDSIIVDKVETNCGDIKLVTDPSKEVMMLLLRLAEMPEAVYPYYGNSDFNIAVDTWFLNYKNHDSVKTIKSLMKNSNINLDDFISLTNIINEDMTGFTVEVKPYSFMVNDVWNSKNAQVVLEAMNKFAIDTKFDKFYVLNRPSYINMHNGVVNALEDGTIEKFISDFYLSGKPVNEEIHISELLCGQSMWYGDGNEVGGKDYVLALSPYWSKEYYFHLLRYLSLPIFNPKMQVIPEQTFEEFKKYMNQLRDKNGTSHVTGYEHKNAVMFDIVVLNNIVYCRENGKTDDYEYLKQDYIKISSEEFVNDMEKAIDEYLAKAPEKRDFVNDLLFAEVEKDLELLKLIVER